MPREPLQGELTVKTGTRTELVNVTRKVAEILPAAFSGICHVFVPHTTAAVTINENADPDVGHDILAEIGRLVPDHNPVFRHAEGNSAAHVKAALLGSGVSIPVARGKLMLGTWQGIFFCEFDGPRSRRIVVQLTPAPDS